MTVYVDEPHYPYGRMIMCHMIADTHEELIDMARLINVPARHIQKQDTPNEHFDICKSKRTLAIKYGAQPITTRELARIIMARRRSTTTDTSSTSDKDPT